MQPLSTNKRQKMEAPDTSILPRKGVWKHTDNLNGQRFTVAGLFIKILGLF
jgi:hypothetical protein